MIGVSEPEDEAGKRTGVGAHAGGVDGTLAVAATLGVITHSKMPLLMRSPLCGRVRWARSEGTRKHARVGA